MAGKIQKQNNDRLLGWICIALGSLPLAIAVGLVKPDPGAVHAPLWVTGICGLVFVFAGVLVMTGAENKLKHVFAGFMLLSFSLASGRVTFYGPVEDFSGGIPFLPDTINVKIARWVFAGGSALCLLLFFYAISQILNPTTESEQTPE